MLKSDIQAIRSTVSSRPVRYAAVFGSRARGDNTADSDFDLLIDYLPGYKYSLLDIADLKLTLEEKLGRSVDVVTLPAARKKLLPLIINDLEVIKELD
ncbi:MAG: nucleotidyltransferase domain-containing protein [Candidatus Berkelbacteria bacterium]|nr:nucleotidyltransferase domain-containing protein [Candidatus Berkelbacteria bacterium]MCR4307729.1 nucleotidyltransferase domain-containing protein [Candidatus Berkelbacteria bacterium]